MKKKIFIISIGYVPVPTPSDKKFILDIVQNLSSQFDITVWSLNDMDDSDNEKSIYCDNNNSYKFYNKNRIFHQSLGSRYKPHPLHSNIRNGLEINLSLLWYLMTHLRTKINECNPDIIHFTDSIGPITSLIKMFYKNIAITITKPTVRISKNPIYNLWVYLSLKKADCVFTFTNFSLKQLEKIGIQKQKINFLPWGIRVSIKNLSEDKKLLIRKRYNCNKDNLLIVVIPREDNESDMHKYIDRVKNMSIKTNAKFVFAIRPTRYVDSFSKTGNDKVFIECGPKDFYDLLSAADISLSNTNIKKNIMSSSLLPLTMMESMIRETPVFTNEAPGIRDLIIDNYTGVIYKTDDDLVGKLLESDVNKNIKNMKTNARNLILKKFNLDKISSLYSNIWKNFSDR
jgi:glycosyltransferase involved in cell wall biosynthesis